jgi:hypothetical protein
MGEARDTLPFGPLLAMYAGVPCIPIGVGFHYDVLARPSPEREKGANAARQRGAEGGSAIGRQNPEHAEQKRRSSGLQTIGEPGRLSGNVRPGRVHCCGPIVSLGTGTSCEPRWCQTV